MKKLTIDQALQQGIAAHKAGHIQEADRLYTAILKTQPQHPDANHNMGVLAIGIGKAEQALPFFKTALETNPKIEQFWLSYIDALIKVERLADAKALFDQAKSHGVQGDGFAQLEERLTLQDQRQLNASNVISEDSENQSNILDTLKLDQALRLANRNVKEASLDDAKRIYQDILAKFPKNKRARVGLKGLSGRTTDQAFEGQDPPENEIQSLINLYREGHFQLALDQISSLLQQFPNSSILYNIRGAVYAGIGQLDASIESYNKALTIKPTYTSVYNNLGNTLQEQGKLDEAIEAYNQALTIKPDYADALINMGNTLKEQGKLDEAIEAYNQAVNIEPDNANAYNNMGNTLKAQGKLNEAIEAYNQALTIDPDYANARHIRSALTGETTNVPPREYVENLFDEYAIHFENSLVVDLEYRTPSILADIVLKQSFDGSLGSVLDLGCGTGLIGEKVRRFCTVLEGVDLSSQMLQQAERKKIYDKLFHGEITQYLSNVELDFDCFISADVFVYLGDLSNVFRLIKSQNKRSGKLVFTVEHTELDGFRLEESGRYSHSRAYIQDLCADFGYTISYFSKANLRKDKGQFIAGGIYILDF